MDQCSFSFGPILYIVLVADLHVRNEPPLVCLDSFHSTCWRDWGSMCSSHLGLTSNCFWFEV
jgi:hypothetical protein